MVRGSSVALRATSSTHGGEEKPPQGRIEWAFGPEEALWAGKVGLWPE